MAARLGSTVAMAVLAMAWILSAQPGMARAEPAAAAGAEAPQRRGAARAAFRDALSAADAALAARRAAEAREGIERAETMLLNARRPGGPRRERVGAALATARAAVGRGEFEEARAALRPLLARLAPAKA